MIDATFLATVEQCYKAGDLQLCHFRLCFGMLTNHYASNRTEIKNEYAVEKATSLERLNGL